MICPISSDGRDSALKKTEGRNKKIRKKSDFMTKHNLWLKKHLDTVITFKRMMYVKKYLQCH